MHTVKLKIGHLPRRQNSEQAMRNARRRWIFDSVVWAASLLFAFGLLIDSALANDAAVARPAASCKAERGDMHWRAYRNLR